MELRVKPLLRVVAASIALALAACATTSAVVEPTVRTSEPRPVSPRDDVVNVQYLRDSTPALLVAVRINDTQVALADARLAQVPRRTDGGRRGGDVVTLTAFAAGQPVGSTTVADQIVNVQENAGIVLQKDRTIHAAIPLARRADVLEVAISATRTVVRVPIADAVYRYCEGAPNEPFCAKAPR